MGCLQIGNQVLPQKSSLKSGIIRNKRQRIEQLSISFYQDKTLQNVQKMPTQLTQSDKQLLSKTISEHFLLYRLPTSQRNKLINCFQIYECKKNTVIFKKHDPASMFFIIRSGTVEIDAHPEMEMERDRERDREMGRDRDREVGDKRLLGIGDYFGDLALLYSAERSATVTAVGDCQFFAVVNQVFRKIVKEIIKKNYQISKNFIQKNSTFCYLSSKQKNSLAYSTLLLKFEKGQVIFTEGDDANCFYMITSGKVQLDIPGKKPLVMTIGQSFGQNSFQQNQVRSGTATSLQQSILLSLSRQSLKSSLGSYLRQISFLNILKWSFNRNELLRQLPLTQKQKLIAEIEIQEYKNKEVICMEGQRAEFIVVVLEDRVNQEGVGGIFNVEYLGAEVQNDLKVQRRLVKNGKGCLAKIKFQTIRKIIGKNLAALASTIPQLNPTHRRLQYINQTNLSQLFILKKIGQGRCSKVFSVIDKLKRVYALKILDKKLLLQQKMTQPNLTQKQVMTTCDNPFLIKLYKTFKDENYLYLLMNYVDGVGLDDVLRQIGVCNRGKSRVFMGCLVMGLEHLHGRGFVHRDLKPENVVVDQLGYLNIVDFGVAKNLTEQNGFRTFTITGTPHFMAPEIINVQGYSFGVDYWSLGIIMYQIVCGSLPFGNDTSDPYEILRQIDAKDLQFPQSYTDQPAKNLLQKLLQKNPSQRTRGQFPKIKSCQFFNSLNWQQLSKRNIKTQFKIKSNPCLYRDQINQPLIKMMRKLRNWGMAGTAAGFKKDVVGEMGEGEGKEIDRFF